MRQMIKVYKLIFVSIFDKYMFFYKLKTKSCGSKILQNKIKKTRSFIILRQIALYKKNIKI